MHTGTISSFACWAVNAFSEPGLAVCSRVEETLNLTGAQAADFRHRMSVPSRGNTPTGFALRLLYHTPTPPPQACPPAFQRLLFFPASASEYRALCGAPPPAG